MQHNYFYEIIDFSKIDIKLLYYRIDAKQEEDIKALKDFHDSHTVIWADNDCLSHKSNSNDCCSMSTKQPMSAKAAFQLRMMINQQLQLEDKYYLNWEARDRSQTGFLHA